MPERIVIEALPSIPLIQEGDDISQIILNRAEASGITFKESDIVCIASKAVSIAEGRRLSLANVEVSEVAKRIHEQVPRKDPRTIQVIIDETGQPDGSRLDIGDNYIGG